MTGTLREDRRTPGDTLGRAEPCPHCGMPSSVELSRSLRWRCRVCGGPRVAVHDRRLAASRAEVEALRRAQRERLPIVGWSVAAAFLAGLGALVLLVALVALWWASPPLGMVVATLALTLVPWLFALFAWRRRRQHQARQQDELDVAWSEAAIQVLEQSGRELTAEALGDSLQLGPSAVERLLLLPRLQDATRTRVTDAAELVYSIAPRLRVREPAEQQGPPEAEPESDLAETNGRVLTGRPRDRGT